ncbi:inactive hydroxysteroid dehydrogenase-like protein 1 [Toxorhynchites rutilus septentrionalis]|uniref:inactive hydroxysteroid dehydrogenase-like protein 1 n=1 Tax=Toxorhynchites rutilus septentrionalis TaxID=329112 RepID=UPI002478ADBD|nr:inactive hydroxysteroid dehydrogenase-like protein 1 [Toxorhynchites rutilus septentrionalis]
MAEDAFWWVGDTFWWIGVYAVFLWSYDCWLESLLCIIWGSLRSLVLREKLPEKYGPWAVVTGSTAGIGKSYAERLAKKGFNIVLVSRSESKLISVAAEIEQKYAVETKWIAVDFTDGPEIYDYLRERLNSFDIGVLVNNVGVLPSLSSFDRNNESEILELVRVNILATTMLSRIVLPGMKARRRGAIVNIASGGGYFPIPYMSGYSASKSFVINFSLALNYELKGTGVECQVASPCITQTNLSARFNDIIPWYALVLTSDTMAKSGVYMIGKTTHTSGHWLHCLQILWWAFLPRSFTVSLIGFLFARRVDKSD